MVCKWILVHSPQTLMCKYGKNKTQSILFICFDVRKIACFALNFDVIDLKYVWKLKNIAQTKSQHSTQNAMRTWKWKWKWNSKLQCLLFLIFHFVHVYFAGRAYTASRTRYQLVGIRWNSGRMLTVFHYLYLDRSRNGENCSFHQKNASNCLTLYPKWQINSS